MKDWERMQLGNFIVEKIEMDEMDFIEVRTVGGEWRVMYRMDSNMFNLISSLSPTDTENRESLKVIISNAYAASSIVDGTFHHDIIVATSNYIERANVVKAGVDPELEEKEHLQAVEEVRVAYEMRKKMENGE